MDGWAARGAVPAVLVGAALGALLHLVVTPVDGDRAAAAPAATQHPGRPATVLGTALERSAAGSATAGSATAGSATAGSATAGSATARSAPGETPIPESVREAVERSVLLAQVHACGVRRQATVTVLARGGSSERGEGPNGVTNAHVVRGADELKVSGAGLGVGRGSVVSFLAGRDAAVVDLAGFGIPPTSGLPLGPRPSVGDRVTVAGFPSGRFTMRSGTVAEWAERNFFGSVADVFVVDLKAQPGASGGVVVDAVGRAVGLVTERDPRSGHVVAQATADLWDRPTGPEIGC